MSRFLETVTGELNGRGTPTATSQSNFKTPSAPHFCGSTSAMSRSALESLTYKKPRSMEALAKAKLQDDEDDGPRRGELEM